ncbi:tRNA lysidine(34) synthetase TilS [Clostridium luticellarii]|uniref:tRNA(Ile)-lysidine synthase n=1 Tax=Clostridium luticellarii TaxID=1691940 RepID=A0A2T0BDB1_9CLOT|nr:tRNA lysidine(34) synthetase TilS [Clostridium luticellarii]MCI1944586.1 tRNA lysidine(34) synthetase TilS [Clostridium luticellarii]MCI1968085.1 tRNA lysidine(34) synthetase TilS [Clostridium luticellarii]MCI1994802.1 tRNA lysidine(34) synthetase TilS [Clostridium luticellarii]MCI2039034.1 tRNA lysidine(34) synthetase TilS [Clostridium luticellarii]PRR81822.1 tRNA(Ile)-lysidine synthase [Clostridium luticellarii]
MIESVLNTIRENNMFISGDRVIVAVSGGPDSICLLHVLYTLREKLNITLLAAHVNHCLRGIEADKDELYVENFCKNLGIQFKSLKIDINNVAKNRNISCESAGREERYKFFKKLKIEFNAQKIAIAHNANDQAETILMRIIRGAGLNGLVGIRPVRDNVFVRPLIHITRDEIEKYCIDSALHPRIDKTNFETVYSRNKIRLELIPYIQKNFNRDIIEVLNRFSDTIKVDNDYLEHISREKFKKYCDIKLEKVIISREAFLEKEAILTRIIRFSLESAVGSLKDFEKIHIIGIIDIQKHSTGKELTLPHNIFAINSYGNIIIRKNSTRTQIPCAEQYKLKIGYNYIPNIKSKIYVKLMDHNQYMHFNQNRFVGYFDYDKVEGDIVLRNRKRGDRLIPLGMSGNKKLKDLFIDLKVAKDRRDSIPLICFGDKIGWVVGYRISELFKVDKNSKTILAIGFESEEL